MSKVLDEAVSIEIAEQIKSKAKSPFDNAYRAALAIDGAVYVQGFLVDAKRPNRPIEYGWIEVGDRIIDPTLPRLNTTAQSVDYFPAQRLTVKQLKSIIEESKEDYPEDDPLPIYGAAPYAYYGDVMLGGQDYQTAFEAAEAKCVTLRNRN